VVSQHQQAIADPSIDSSAHILIFVNLLLFGPPSECVPTLGRGAIADRGHQGFLVIRTQGREPSSQQKKEFVVNGRIVQILFFTEFIGDHYREGTGESVQEMEPQTPQDTSFVTKILRDDYSCTRRIVSAPSFQAVAKSPKKLVPVIYVDVLISIF
jgi:hypothetical protein